MTFEAKWWEFTRKTYSLMWTKSHNNQRAHNEWNSDSLSETLQIQNNRKKNIRSQRTLTASANSVTHNNNKKARSNCMMKQHKNNIMVLGIMRINKKPIAKCASLHWHTPRNPAKPAELTASAAAYHTLLHGTSTCALLQHSYTDSNW
jgi:hypothetical protein